MACHPVTFLRFVHKTCPEDEERETVMIRQIMIHKERGKMCA